MPIPSPYRLRSRSLRSLRFAARPAVLIHHLGLLLMPLGALTCVPALVSWATGASSVALRHLGVGCVLVGLGACGWWIGSRRPLQRNEALVLTPLVFAIASAAAAIPLAGYGLKPIDAWFEATSGATTTGLSVLGSLEGAPPGLLFSRAWLQWIGGLGVLVLALALIVTPGASAQRMGFSAREMGDVSGGTRAHARRVLVVYVILTAMGVVGLLLLGAGGADALLHCLAAVSTGGFAAHDGSLAALSGPVRTGVIALCFAGAVPFSCYYLTLHRHPLGILRDPSLRHLVLVTAVCVLGLAAIHRATTDPASSLGLADRTLLAVSAQTTAGFSSMPISDLAHGEKLLVIGSMFVGGGMGSTAGGIKIFRLMVCLRILVLVLDRIAILRFGRLRLRVEGKPVSSEEVEGVVAVVATYAAVVVLSWMAFLVHGYDPIDALFEVVSAVGTVGLSTGITGAELPSSLKGVLSVDMLLGRVEVLAFLVLLRPATWWGRRRGI